MGDLYGDDIYTFEDSTDEIYNFEDSTDDVYDFGDSTEDIYNFEDSTDDFDNDGITDDIYDSEGTSEGPHCLEGGKYNTLTTDDSTVTENEFTNILRDCKHTRDTLNEEGADFSSFEPALFYHCIEPFYYTAFHWFDTIKHQNSEIEYLMDWRKDHVHFENEDRSIDEEFLNRFSNELEELRNQLYHVEEAVYRLDEQALNY